MRSCMLVMLLPYASIVLISMIHEGNPRHHHHLKADAHWHKWWQKRSHLNPFHGQLPFGATLCMWEREREIEGSKFFSLHHLNDWLSYSFIVEGTNPIKNAPSCLSFLWAVLMSLANLESTIQFVVIMTIRIASHKWLLTYNSFFNYTRFKSCKIVQDLKRIYKC